MTEPGIVQVYHLKVPGLIKSYFTFALDVDMIESHILAYMAASMTIITITCIFYNDLIYTVSSHTHTHNNYSHMTQSPLKPCIEVVLYSCSHNRVLAGSVD